MQESVQGVSPCLERDTVGQTGGPESSRILGLLTRVWGLGVMSAF
jgi:hypothetical protein